MTGNPSTAYNYDSGFTGTNVATNNISWFEAAQFVNWLNTSTGHQPAYKFTGTQGTTDYTFETWDISDNGYNPNNPYRNSNTFYFLPTENEWVKAAYWNGTNLQTYATKPDENLTQGNGTSGIGWNYYSNGWATNPSGPWAVGSGSEELNGTYDMMGNVFEWTESPYADANYGASSIRTLRGGSYLDPYYGNDFLRSSLRGMNYPYDDYNGPVGFRVASIPEPTTLSLLALGGLLLWKRKINFKFGGKKDEKIGI